MNKNLTTIILVSLVILNFIDGDFRNPSTLDYIKFAIIAIGLILNLIVRSEKLEP